MPNELSHAGLRMSTAKAEQRRSTGVGCSEWLGHGVILSHQNFHQRLRFGAANVAVPVALVGPPGGSAGSLMVGAAEGLGGKLILTLSGSRCFFSGSSSSGPRPTAVWCGGRGGGRLPDDCVFGCESSFSMAFEMA
jgi:hypothetical protein